jgi:2-phosphoglycerate kinase
MFNVCPACGEYSVEKVVEQDGSEAVAVCPSCHHAAPFLRLPLFVITGASGAGKSTVCQQLVRVLRGQYVALESDILWGVVPATAEEDFRDYRNVWLRLAKNIGQCGLPVVLCGTAVPDQFGSCPERRYFSALHYLALVCDDDELRKRLTSRPAWRQSHTESFVEQMVAFNRWLKEHAALTVPPLSLHDTSSCGIEETVSEATAWIRERLPQAS